MWYSSGMSHYHMRAVVIACGDIAGFGDQAPRPSACVWPFRTSNPVRFSISDHRPDRLYRDSLLAARE